MITCNNCNTENQDSSKFCINCGDPLIVETGRRGPRPARRPARRNNTEIGGYVEGKTPAVSCLLSLLVVGAGQFYNGDTKKGAYMLGVAVVLSLVSLGIGWFALAIYSAYDAYQVAEGNKQLGEW